MPIKLFTDHNIDIAIPQGLRNLGVDVLTAYEDQAHRQVDEVLLARTSELGRVLFTHDNDLIKIGREWQSKSKEFAGIIYVTQNKMSIGDCIRDLVVITQAGELEDLMNRIEFLPL